METWEKEYSAPIVDEDSRPFWDAATEGRFLLRHCEHCKKAHWYPRPICPFCLKGETKWIESSGVGIIYTYTAVRRTEQPFILAFVTLDDGPTLLTNIVDCDHAEIKIGDRVEVAFRPATGSGAIPVFRPRAGRGG